MYREYYDLIHANYDYDLDIEIVDTFCKDHNLNVLYLLEVGCGTGRHTALLSKRISSIFAIDIDSHMIESAKKYIQTLGIQNVLFFHLSALDLRKININPCNIACSFFNVINYLLDFDSLVQFFSGISVSLTSSGVLIFDSLDASKKYEENASFVFTYETSGTKIVRNIVSLYNSTNQTLHVNEKYSRLTDNNISVDKITYKIWNREQVEKAACLAGFRPFFFSKKIDVNSKYKKTNQSIFIMKKE